MGIRSLCSWSSSVVLIVRLTGGAAADLGLDLLDLVIGARMPRGSEYVDQAMMAMAMAPTNVLMAWESTGSSSASVLIRHGHPPSPWVPVNVPRTRQRPPKCTNPRPSWRTPGRPSKPQDPSTYLAEPPGRPGAHAQRSEYLAWDLPVPDQETIMPSAR